MRICEKALVVVCMLCATAGLGWASEQRVKLSDLPLAVQATVKEQSKGATVRGYAKEVENGKTTYEVEMTINGHGKDISMDQKGTVIEVEEEVPLDNIPSSAKSAIEKAAGGGKILKVESVVHGATVVAYEAQVQHGSKRSEVRVSPEGKPAPE
ncbi:MAG: hypothetical protein ABSF45_07870 [Terriglobia bacterium]